MYPAVIHTAWTGALPVAVYLRKDHRNIPLRWIGCRALCQAG